MAEHKEHHAQHEAIRKRLAEERQVREQQIEERTDMQSGIKPTPTQEENDLAASGVHLLEHEPDGSPPDVGMQPATTATDRRQIEAKPANRGAYQTRAEAKPAT